MNRDIKEKLNYVKGPDPPEFSSQRTHGQREHQAMATAVVSPMDEAQQKNGQFIRGGDA